jgi:hypothetical protein
VEYNLSLMRVVINKGHEVMVSIQSCIQKLCHLWQLPSNNIGALMQHLISRLKRQLDWNELEWVLLGLKLIGILAILVIKDGLDSFTDMLIEGFSMKIPSLKDVEGIPTWEFGPVADYEPIYSYLLALLYYQRRDLEKSEKVVRKLLENSNNFPPGNFLLGVILLELNLFVDSIEQFEICVKSSFRVSDSLNNIGYLYTCQVNCNFSRLNLRENIGQLFSASLRQLLWIFQILLSLSTT